jgi:hypothetical protein
MGKIILYRTEKEYLQRWLWNIWPAYRKSCCSSCSIEGHDCTDPWASLLHFWGPSICSSEFLWRVSIYLHLTMDKAENSGFKLAFLDQCAAIFWIETHSYTFNNNSRNMIIAMKPFAALFFHFIGLFWSMFVKLSLPRYISHFFVLHNVVFEIHPSMLIFYLPDIWQKCYVD